VLLFDPATDPYSPAQLLELVRARNFRWLIVKRELQIKEDVTQGNRMKGMSHEDHLEVSGHDFSRAENEAVKTTFGLRSGFRKAKTGPKVKISMKDDLRHG